jgi:hypothetical protein
MDSSLCVRTVQTQYVVNVCVVRLMSLVVHCLQLLVVRPCLLVVIFVVASCWLSGGDVESSVSVTSTRAHTLTHKKKKKKNVKESLS